MWLAPNRVNGLRSGEYIFKRFVVAGSETLGGVYISYLLSKMRLLHYYINMTAHMVHNGIEREISTTKLNALDFISLCSLSTRVVQRPPTDRFSAIGLVLGHALEVYFAIALY